MKKTSEILGYPSDARLLIVNIDDVGFCYTANESAIHTMRHGVASSLTIMVPCPWGLHGLRLLAENPDIPFGVHLTAVSEHEIFRWGPVCRAEEVPSLVDGRGFFFTEERRDDLIAGASVRELEREFRKQIDIVLEAGLSPTHLDSHCNIHDSRKDIFEMTVALAKEYGLALRVHEPRYIRELKEAGYAVIDHPDVDSFRLPTEGKDDLYETMLRELPAGLSEWAIHPARETDELKSITEEWPVRDADYRFFNSERASRVMKEEGIILMRYNELQKFWKK
jgi:chitin disaccharide deacetylase